MEHSELIILGLVFAGAIGGFLAGLMGIGGGIVLVPVLYSIFTVVGVDPTILMHLAVATSLGVIIPTAISSSRAQHKRGAIDYAVIRTWGPLLVLGAIAGAFFAVNLKAGTLTLFFAVMASLMGIKLLLPLDHKVISKSLPGPFPGGVIGLTIGAASSLMGIGGATFSVPTMTLFGVPIHRAVGTASLLGLLIALPATVGYIWGGWGVTGLPDYSFGYVNLLTVVIVAPISTLMAPVGVATSHKLPKRALSVFFGLFLITAGIRMAYPFLSA